MRVDERPLNNGQTLMTISVESINAGKSIQERVTILMMSLLKRYNEKANTKYTLANTGYLHMCSLAQIGDHLEMSIFFAPEFQNTSAYKAMLGALENWVYVGNYEDCVVPRTMDVVNYKINHGEIVLRDDKKPIEKTVNVLQCNINLTMAAILGCRLSDPYYTVSFATQANKKATAVAVRMGAGYAFPVAVTVTRTKEIHTYNPDEALQYLINLHNTGVQRRRMVDDLSGKVADGASKKKKQQAKEKQKKSIAIKYM